MVAFYSCKISTHRSHSDTIKGVSQHRKQKFSYKDEQKQPRSDLRDTKQRAREIRSTYPCISHSRNVQIHFVMPSLASIRQGIVNHARIRLQVYAKALLIMHMRARKFLADRARQVLGRSMQRQLAIRYNWIDQVHCACGRPAHSHGAQRAGPLLSLSFAIFC
jgi:hypothetical protein